MSVPTDHPIDYTMFGAVDFVVTMTILPCHLPIVSHLKSCQCYLLSELRRIFSLLSSYQHSWLVGHGVLEIINILKYLKCTIFSLEHSCSIPLLRGGIRVLVMEGVKRKTVEKIQNLIFLKNTRNCFGYPLSLHIKTIAVAVLQAE